jgi:dTDP-4-dehydrorhamnose reductase
MTVLVLGASGQLATHLREHLSEAVLWGRAHFDLADAAALPTAVSALRPSAIVNAAAYTAVDKAEREPDLAWRINVDGAAMAARAAAVLDIPLIHLSTDYVFDGSKTTEYDVTDCTGPINVYGTTKLAGELAVRALCHRAWILRTSWVFSEHGANFVKTMLRIAEQNDTLRVVADQRGRPTYAGDLAQLIAALVQRKDTLEPPLLYGTYHAVGGKVVSWYEFALTIFAHAFEIGLLAKRPMVGPISTAEYVTAARRPANSALRPSGEIQTALGIGLDWERGLQDTLAALRHSRL